MTRLPVASPPRFNAANHPRRLAIQRDGRVLDPVIESFSRAGIFAPAIAIARARTNGACTVYGS
jgi:hypothetical protein